MTPFTLVEARRVDRDAFFGERDGWYVVAERSGRRFTAGEALPHDESESFRIAFESDGYATTFRLPTTARRRSMPSRLWLSCADSITRLHVTTAEQPSRTLSSAKSRRRQMLIKQVSSYRASFRQESSSKYKKQVVTVGVRYVQFFANRWSADSEVQDALQLTISFGDCEPEHFYATGKSEVISPMREFDTYSAELNVSLVRINESLSRVIAVDSHGMGYREGVRVGDLLVSDHSSGARRWRRMELRRVLFDCSAEFDYEGAQDTTREQTDELLTFTLRLSPSQGSVINDAAFEPLEYLFGAEPIIESNGVGNCQLQFTVDHINKLVIGLVHCSSMTYLKIVDPVIHLEDRQVYPIDVCLLRLNVKASFGLSLISTSPQGYHSDLSLIAFQDLSIHQELFADKSMILETSLRSFQVDDQRQDAAFPVAIFPTPIGPIEGGGPEGEELIPADAPSLRMSMHLRSTAESNLIAIKAFEVFLAETTLKLHESFLLNLAEFASTLNPSKKPTAKPTEATEAGKSIAIPTSQSKRIFVEYADFKPMRFNITFTSSSSGSEKRVQMLVRQIPFVSALITAVTSISDAPLRLGAVRLEKESKTSEAIAFAITKHYSNEVMRGLLAIAGSTDILGSPVNLLGSFSQGTFSFFYEPALALSMGYGNIGRGLRKAGREFLSSAAGGVFESLSKMTKAVAKAIAQSSADPVFMRSLERQLKNGSFEEPINVREGLSNGMLVLLRSILDAIVGFYPSNRRRRRMGRPAKSRINRITKSLLSLILKPSAGFFAAVSQFATGWRNILTRDAFNFCFPLRLPRPRETKLLPYTPSRSAGFLLARNRFGPDVKFIVNEICQLKMQINNVTKHALVTTLVITDGWIVACRETLLDVWAIPLQAINGVKVLEKELSFQVLGRDHIIRCRSRTDVQTLHQAIEFATKMRKGLTTPNESFANYVTLPIKKGLPSTDSLTRSGSLMRLPDLHQIVGGSEIDVAGCRVGSAEIQSSGYWPDGVFRYRVQLISQDSKVEWVIERRYSEFLRFRDQACRFLSVSRRSIPLPPRRPWSLSLAEMNERRKGLQHMLNISLRIDLLAESEVLREFLTRGADFVVIKED